MSDPRIRILDDGVVNRIAAGEVVERPASILKELVENALDAGATDIRVDIEGGGGRLVRVADDGHGMSRPDALLCIERHATSKIRTDADLAGVATLGFRGEALASIAAVSRFELVTRRPEDEAGTRLFVEGGRLVAVEACGCPAGTRATARDLFFQIPARRAFLRSAATEYAHCLEALVRLALLRPDVDFAVTHDGRETLRAPREADSSRRVASLLGAAAEGLRHVEFATEAAQVRGFCSPAGVHRQASSGAAWHYVNGRFVRDGVLRRAVAEAYRGLVPLGRHPVVVLDLTVPPGEVDVNVHPTKVEVRFRRPAEIESAVRTALGEALQEHRPIRPERPVPVPPPRIQAPLPLPRRTEPLPVLPDGPGLVADAPLPPRPPPDATLAIGRGPPAPSRSGQAGTLPVGSYADLRVIGQLAGSFVLCEAEGDLVLVDQHAAHERITLERLQRAAAAAARGGPAPAQVLLSPVLVELPAARAAALEAGLPSLMQIGMDVVPWGDRTFAVRSVPAGLPGLDPEAVVREVAEDLAAEGSGQPLRDREARILATLACHTSVRANHALSLVEMRAILDGLDAVDHAVCAHGRPVAIRISAAEIRTRFHRA
ncbi:MAG: DNA mismatch repair endonuclease MutL [Deltaproteobacteria bacterium]|nr:DNA mismatch repair endonuclease MutL [Deltaproteobacteria bacterium]